MRASFWISFLLVGCSLVLAVLYPPSVVLAASPITSSGLNTQVTLSQTPPVGKTQYDITGGTRPGGGVNLFHSFGNFNVPTNNIANFLNSGSIDLNGAIIAVAPTISAAQTDEEVARRLSISVEQVQRLHTARALSNKALEQLPVELLPRVLRRLEHLDLPQKRVTFRLLQEKDERGLIPHGARLNALKQLQTMHSKQTGAKSEVAGVPSGQKVHPQAFIPFTAGLPPDHSGWISLGPGNIGGRTRSIVIQPTNPQTMWVASVGGGVWRTDDGGNSFVPVDDLMTNLSVSCMVMDPTNPQIIYAGTGEGFYNSDVIRGAGIFRTVDGTNWKQLQSTKGPDFQSVNRLAISPDGKVLLAATQTGIFHSADGRRSKWSRQLAAEVADIKFHPSDNTKAIAAGLRNGRAYYSIDGGMSWKPASHAGPEWSGRVELAYARHDPSIIYASVQIKSGEIWRSTDGGKTYSKRSSLMLDGSPANYLGEQGWYDSVIWAGDPINADLVIVGGIDLWKSSDGGNTLIDISTWSDDRSAHADHHVIVASPAFNGTTNKTVFFGNDGGLFRTDDLYTVGNNPDPPRTNGWINMNHGYIVTQFYSGAGNVETGTMIGGTQDTGTLRFTTVGGSEKWTAMFGGDGGWSASDPKDSNYFYGEYVYLNIHCSSDGGAHSEYISGQYWNGSDWVWKPFPYYIPDAKFNESNFIAPFILDPNNENTMLAGGMSLWRTSDVKTPNTVSTGPKWASIKPSVGSPISAIAVANDNSDTIWVGHNNGDVYKTTNGAQGNPIWQKLDENGSTLLPNRYVTRITIDPRDSKVVYVTFGGYTKGNAWKTTDGGSTWINIGKSLPEAPVRTLVIHPRTPKFLYIGSEVGIFASEDGGLNWSPNNEGPTSCSVDELFWVGDALVAATHGRGMFKIKVTSSVQ